MDNNNYQPQNEQTQGPKYSAPEYQNLSKPADLPQDIHQKIEELFSQALAATIMSVFPVASIIALIKGKAILPDIIALIEKYDSLGIACPGKLKTAKILAMVGKFAGLGFTIYYAVGITSFILNLTLSILFNLFSPRPDFFSFLF